MTLLFRNPLGLFLTLLSLLVVVSLADGRWRILALYRNSIELILQQAYKAFGGIIEFLLVGELGQDCILHR